MPYKSFRRQGWLALGLTLGISLGAGIFQLKRSYENIRIEQQDRLRSQAGVISQNLERQLQGVTNALAGLREELLISRQNGGTSIPALSIRTLTAAMPGVMGISILDANGVVLMSDKADLLGRSFYEREYFQIPRRRNDPTMVYVSPPFRSSRGTYSINLSKTLADSEGRFVGVVTANLDPEYFGIVARSVLYASDMVVNIADQRGEIFVDARSGAPLDVREGVGTDEIFQTHLLKGAEVSATDRWVSRQGQIRMIAVRNIFPASLRLDSALLVVVSRDIDAVFLPWQDDLKLYIISYALLTLTACTAVFLVQQRQKSTLQRIDMEAEQLRQSDLAAGLQSANAELERLTITDGLTGVGNRRHFDQMLISEWARCGRAQVPLALLMIDIDHFKAFNDYHGHVAGDAVLVRVASVLSQSAKRSGEIVARYGGEEFAILLPDTELTRAHTVAHACLQSIRNAQIPHGGSPVSGHVTASVGIVSWIPSSNSTTLQLIEAADSALYSAKKAGRNRVMRTASETPNVSLPRHTN